MIRVNLVHLGARIPMQLKRKVADYCDRKGIKLQFFITKAIEEKLAEIEQGEVDNKIVDERLKIPKFTSKEELEKYVTYRRKTS